MIDVVINSVGAIVVVHDERGLDGVSEALISKSTGEVRLLGEFGERSIGKLVESMLQILDPSRPGLSMRVSGFSLAKSEGIKIRLED